MADEIKKSEVKADKKDERTPQQIEKQRQLTEKKAAEEKKLAEVSKKVQEQAKVYESALLGSWIEYKDAAGFVSPSMVVGVSTKGEGNELKGVVTVLVYSAKTAAPYRAEVIY